MSNLEPVWRWSLDVPPAIRLGGIGRHGADAPSQSYEMKESWCLHWYEYHGLLEIGNWQSEIRPGMVSIVPSGERLVHRWSRANCRHYFVHFCCARSMRQSGEVSARFFNLGEAERSLIVTAATEYKTHPARATAALWECQWKLTRHYAQQLQAAPDPMDALERFMENHLSKTPSLSKAAEACGLSPNHANTLWKKRTGRTICTHWRLRRIETALGLLRNTDMGVKQVALQLGFYDLQQFNKLVRRLAGCSPRALRPIENSAGL